MNETCHINIIFVVCHPDDEALWVGGLVHGLERLPDVSVHVICLSGACDSSPRSAEFFAAKRVAGYVSGVVMGSMLGEASERLPLTSETVIAALAKLRLSFKDIDLLITHSPYGDEHMHPHHVQACEELYKWSKAHDIPFGYFSCVPLANAYHEPVLRNMKRLGSLQLLNYAWCRYGLVRRLMRWKEGKPWRYPLLYTQWLVDPEIKQKMLSCYESIGLQKHKDGYAMFSNNVETLYVFNHKGVEVVDRLVANMEIPGAGNFFPGTWTDVGIKSKIFGMQRGKRGI